MIDLDFDQRFADDVEAGIKTQTIRRGEKCKRGDALHLCSGDRVLANAICARVCPILIDHYGITLDGQRLYAGSALRGEDDDCDNDFAKEDGFDGFMEMAEWFSERYGLPFKGHLIKWRLL